MSESARPPKPSSKSSSRAGAPRSAAPQLPPKVVKLPPKVVKKKKPARRDESEGRRKKGPSDPPSEFLVPIILIAVGLVATTLTTIMLRPATTPLGLWVAIRMTIIVVSALLTYGALFIAAQVLDTDYGYISTGALKVAAITLTQDWVGDLATRIPIPLLPWIVAVGTTYGMFMYFFDIDLREAIASVFVVRLVHWVAVIVIFMSVMTAIVGGAAVDLSIPAAALAPGDANDEADVDDEDDPGNVQNMPANFQNPANLPNVQNHGGQPLDGS
jgi:hypothetical protein